MLAGGDLEDQADTVAESVAELLDLDQLGLIDPFRNQNRLGGFVQNGTVLYGHDHICLPMFLSARPESALSPAQNRSTTCTAPAAP